MEGAVCEEEAAKLEGDGEFVQPLIALLEREDSGIDSDDARRPALRHFSSDESCSDEEHMAVMKLPRGRSKRKSDDFMKGTDDSDMNPEAASMLDCPCMRPMPRLSQCRELVIEDFDRNSPPLLEVELTASDEDDDASVLELVIPMQTKRYQKIPTSSPKRGLRIPLFTCSFICCFPK